MIPRCLALCVFCASAVAGETGNVSAVSALRKAHPSVRWDKKSVVNADITCSGKSDQIVVGYGRDESVWIGLMKNDGHSVAVQFPIGGNSQNSICSTPVRIEILPLVCSDKDVGDLPGCKEVKGCYGFSIVDDGCDSLHFYWNFSAKELVWWRR